jgi:AraC family transcriptional regulator
VLGSIELVRDRRQVHSTAKGRIDVEGGCVEIREFEWDRAGWVAADSGHFYISQLMAPLKGREQVRWYCPGDAQPLSVSQFGVHVPSVPMLIEHGSGRTCFLICEMDIARFRKITGPIEWPREWAQRGLSSQGPFFKAILDRLTGEVLRPHAHSAAFVDALLTAFVMELHRVVQYEEQSKERCGLNAWQIGQINRMIKDSGPAMPAIAEIAARCGVSLRYLTQNFREAQGMTLQEYMAEIRLERARTMLSESRKPLKVVAVEAGFATPSHFSASFRRAIGCSPSEYRSNIRAL